MRALPRITSYNVCYTKLLRDGRYASVTDWDSGDLAIRDLETGEVRRLTHNPGEWEPGFADGHLISRDGEWVVVAWYEWGENAGYRLGIVPITGGDLV